MHEQGQHLVVDCGWYQHHGIGLANGDVVHFGRGLSDLKNACVEVVSCDIFANGREIRSIESASNFEPQEIVTRALSRVGERGYEVFGNNCEHFVSWCRIGVHESAQITMTETAIRQTAAISSRQLVGRAIAKSSASKLPLLAARGTVIATLVADIAQTATELAATSCGKTQQESKQLGRQVGFASSATVGFAVGGPPGAAAGICFWITGQILGEQTVKRGTRAAQSVIDGCGDR